MILAPVIALDPTAAQEKHFRKACGVARLAYNGALAQWKRQYEAGERPSAYKLKIKWNEIRVRREGRRNGASSPIELVASVRMRSTRRLPWSPAPSRQSLSKL